MHKLLGSLTGLALALVGVPALAQAPAPAAPAAAPAAPSPPTPGADLGTPAAAAPTAPVEVAPPASPAAPPPALAAPAASPTPAAPTPPAEAKPAPVGPEKLAIGKALQGYFQPSLLLQFWGFYSHNPNITTGDKNASTFRVRRAEVRVKGDIIPNLLSYNLMFDPAKAFAYGSKNLPVTGQVPAPDTAGQVAAQQPSYTDPAILQDYFITLKSDYADVSLGQFKIPVSYEGFNGASKIIFPERALVARQYGDRRELGVKVEKKLGDYFFYSLGIFNGSGVNTTDNDNEKDVALRLEAYPIKGLTVAGVGYRTFGERDGGYRDRLEADVRYEGYDVLVLGEYIHAWDGPKGKEIEGHGAYGTLGYTFLKSIQPVARFGFLNPNKDLFGDRVRHYEGGINYYLQALEARATLAVSAFELQDKKAANGTLSPQKTRWEAILAFQAGF
ncbi:MAG TPA: porin [Polyangiaceae bacterium]|nr:porin [Polyangiaceae bacterium]